MPSDAVQQAYDAIMAAINDETADLDDEDEYAVLVRLGGEINSRIDDDDELDDDDWE